MSLSIYAMKHLITHDRFNQFITDDIISLCKLYFGYTVEFVFQEIDDGRYQIHIIFDGDLNNHRMLTFAKTRTANNDDIVMDHYLHYVCDLASKGSNVMDIWPLNGIIKKKQFVKNALKGELKYLNELSKVSKVKKQFFNSDSLKIMVLDLKHKNTNYKDQDGISKHEREIAQFFHANNKTKISKKAAKQLAIYKLIKEEFHVDYILKEGSLKHDLLYNANIFNQDEINYFNTSDGGKDLCQLCELIMNGFKTLYQITIQHNNNNEMYTFHPTDYFIHIPSIYNKQQQNIEIAQIQNVECMIQNIDLTTFYPQCYLNVYSKNNAYYKCISKFNKFQLKHDVFDDFSNITCIQIGDKKAKIDAIFTFTVNK